MPVCFALSLSFAELFRLQKRKKAVSCVLCVRVRAARVVGVRVEGNTLRTSRTTRASHARTRLPQATFYYVPVFVGGSAREHYS